MLNQEKVKSMTKAAAYENGPEKKNIQISSYFRGDFLGLQMIKSAIAYVVVFCIIIVIWAMGRIDELMLMISRSEYLESLIKTLVVLFVSGLVVYECVTYIYFASRYEKAKRSLKGYQAHLKKIHKFYETQESADISEKKEITADEEKTL